MDKEDAHIVIAMANHNMNVTDVARAIFAHRNTVLYHLDKVKRQTGLDPRRFYDLVELVKIRDEQNRRKEQPTNKANGNQKSLGRLKGAKTVAR